jgi:hypothetical protein
MTVSSPPLTFSLSFSLSFSLHVHLRKFIDHSLPYICPFTSDRAFAATKRVSPLPSPPSLSLSLWNTNDRTFAAAKSLAPLNTIDMSHNKITEATHISMQSGIKSRPQLRLYTKEPSNLKQAEVRLRA